jgi:histidinol-phosphate aminotransferase
MADGVRELGLWVAESDANFIWLRLPDAEDPAAAEAAIVAGLRERGVLVRAGAALGEAGALRVTVGTPAENERFVAALRAVLA